MILKNNKKKTIIKLIKQIKTTTTKKHKVKLVERSVKYATCTLIYDLQQARIATKLIFSGDVSRSFLYSGQ